MISAGPRVGSRCPRTHHAAALQVNVPLGRLDSLWSRVGRVGVASVSLRASVEVGSPPRPRGKSRSGGDILGFAGYGRGVEPRAPGRTTRARVSPRGGWPAHLLSRANVRRHAVPVERRETRCCARSFLSQPQKLRAKSRVDPDAPVSVSFPSALTSFFGGTSTQSRAPAALSPWVSWTCSRRRTRRRWSGSGSPSSARRCAAWTGKSEASLPASRNVS